MPRKSRKGDDELVHTSVMITKKQQKIMQKYKVNVSENVRDGLDVQLEPFYEMEKRKRILKM